MMPPCVLRILVVLLLSGLAAPAAPPPETARPNVVLLSVDTLRADYLGAYDCAVDTSPNLDAFAKEALLFTDAVCEVPLTGPSFFIRRDDDGVMTGTTRNGLRMPDDVPLVSERFKEADYHTFCVQSNWTLKAHLSGLDRGFDTYADGFEKKRWGFIKPERLADDVTDVALKLLDERDPDAPFFAWIHYTDPHAPYIFRKQFNPAMKPRFFMKNKHKVRFKYASEVAFTDHHIGRLLEALPRENTFILFVADHGESLYEHDYLGHGRRIFQTGMHIPLMIRGKGVLPGYTAEPARGIDIGPTLLGLADLAPPKSMLGLDITRHAPKPGRVRVFETYGGAVPGLPGAEALMADAPPMRQGVIAGGWKLILGGGAPQLYYLPDDPGEEENLASAEPDRVRALKAHIEAWDADTAKGEENVSELSTEDQRALEALGYIE